MSIRSKRTVAVYRYGYFILFMINFLRQKDFCIIIPIEFLALKILCEPKLR